MARPANRKGNKEAQKEKVKGMIARKKEATDESKKSEAAEIAELKAKGEALEAQAMQDKIDADLAELAKNPPPPPEAPTADSAAEKAIAKHAATGAEDTLAMRKGGFEDVPEDFTPSDTIKTLRAESPSQDMLLETGQPGPTGGGGRIKQVEEVARPDPEVTGFGDMLAADMSRGYDHSAFKQDDDSIDVAGGYTNPDLTPEAAAREAAAEKAVAKHVPDRWQGRGGYNFTLIPGDKAKGTEASILVEAPIGRKDSSMKEGTQALITPDTPRGEAIFRAILDERYNKPEHVGEYGKRWSGGPSKSPPPPPRRSPYDTNPLPESDIDPVPESDIDPVPESDIDPVPASLLEGGEEAGSSEGEPEGEVDRVTLRQDYEGGDPTPDEIKDAVSELSPSAAAAKQRFNLRQAEQRVQQARSAVQQAEAKLAEATQITETTGDATTQTEIEALLAREKANLGEEEALLRSIAQSMRGDPVSLADVGDVTLEKAAEYTAPERTPTQSAPWGPK